MTIPLGATGDETQHLGERENMLASSPAAHRSELAAQHRLPDPAGPAVSEQPRRFARWQERRGINVAVWCIALPHDDHALRAQNAQVHARSVVARARSIFDLALARALLEAMPRPHRQPTARAHAEVRAMLRAARQDAGLRQADLAPLLGLYRRAVHLMETGQRRIDLVEAVEWCLATGLPVGRLVRLVESSARARVGARAASGRTRPAAVGTQRVVTRKKAQTQTRRKSPPARVVIKFEIGGDLGGQ